MWCIPTKKQLDKIPTLYSTESTPLKDKIIHMHFFLASCDWYIAEWDERDDVFFVFCILNGDMEMAEWGYVSFDELKSIKLNGRFEVDRDKFWKPIKAIEVDNIRVAQGW